jgi:acetyl esterase/lipase
VLYVTDKATNVIRKVTLAGKVTTVGGSASLRGGADGVGNAARLSAPSGVAVDGAGVLLVADSNNNTIRRAQSLGHSSSQTEEPVAASAGVSPRGRSNSTIDDTAIPPTITVQPLDSTHTVNEVAAFVVTASGTDPLTYQWRKNGVNIRTGSYATATYNTPRVQPSDDGSLYSVVVTNSAGSVTSVGAKLSVPPNEVYGMAPDGTILTWDVYTPTGSGPWPAFIMIHGGGFTGGSPTTSQDSVTIDHDLQAAGYIVFAVNYRAAPPGHVTGQTSTGYAPQQYDDVKMAVRAARADSRCNGLVGSFGGSAGGAHAAWVGADNTTTPLWSGNDRVNVVVCMSGPYDFVDYTPCDTLDGFVGNVTSYCGVPDTTDPTPKDRALLLAASPITPVDSTVKPMFLVSSEGDTQPAAQQPDLVAALDAALGGQPKNYESLVVSGDLHAFPNWFVIISGTQTVKAEALAFIANAFATATPPPSPSPTPTITPTPTPTPTPPTPPVITAQPTDQTVVVGRRASFHIAATGTTPFTYQWMKNGVNIAGATGPAYTTPPTTAGDNGSIFAILVSNSAGSALSNNATLTITIPAPPVITTQPVDKTVTAGKTATFSVVASGTGTLTYQWMKNGANITGATKRSYTTPPTTPADNGSLFSVLVNNSYGSVTSNNAKLTVQ